MSTMASVELICGSTAIMKPSAAICSDVVKEGCTTAVPPPVTAVAALLGVIVK